MLALPATLVALTARLLHGMGRIKHHRAMVFPHDGQASHVRHQGVVAKRHTTLTHHDVVLVAIGLTGFLHHVTHVSRRHKLAFFYVDRLTGFRTSHNKIGLAA